MKIFRNSPADGVQPAEAGAFDREMIFKHVQRIDCTGKRKMMARCRRVCEAYLGVALLIVGVPGLSAPRAAQFTAFHSDRYQYTLRYPSGWFTNSLSRSGELFDIINFRPSRAAQAVFLPPTGVEISITPIEARQGPTEPRSSVRREVPHTLEQWIAIATRGQEVEQTRKLTIAGRLPVIEVRMKGADGLEALDWYLSLHGRLFDARLLCWIGNPDVEGLRQVFEQIV